jgi:hypothetical protein
VISPFLDRPVTSYPSILINIWDEFRSWKLWNSLKIQSSRSSEKLKFLEQFQSSEKWDAENDSWDKWGGSVIFSGRGFSLLRRERVGWSELLPLPDTVMRINQTTWESKEPADSSKSRQQKKLHAGAARVVSVTRHSQLLLDMQKHHWEDRSVLRNLIEKITFALSNTQVHLMKLIPDPGVGSRRSKIPHSLAFEFGRKNWKESETTGQNKRKPRRVRHNPTIGSLSGAKCREFAHWHIWSSVAHSEMERLQMPSPHRLRTFGLRLRSGKLTQTMFLALWKSNFSQESQSSGFSWFA